MGVYENLLPGKENALTPEYLTVKCHFSSVRKLIWVFNKNPAAEPTVQ